MAMTSFRSFYSVLPLAFPVLRCLARLTPGRAFADLRFGRAVPDEGSGRAG
jgi:hypothetical protein